MCQTISEKSQILKVQGVPADSEHEREVSVVVRLERKLIHDLRRRPIHGGTGSLRWRPGSIFPVSQPSAKIPREPIGSTSSIDFPFNHGSRVTVKVNPLLTPGENELENSRKLVRFKKKMAARQ